MAHEEGVALLLAVMVVLLLSVIGCGLLLTASSEFMIAGNFRQGQESLHAANAGLEIAVAELLLASDWQAVVDGLERSALAIGPPTLPSLLDDGVRVSPEGVASAARARAGGRPGAGRRWQPYLYGRLSDILAVPDVSARHYVVILVADPSDGDDSSVVAGSGPGAGVLILRAEALGLRGGRKAVEATLARTGASGGNMLSWRGIR